jgi:hypothetical protein
VRIWKACCGAAHATMPTTGDEAQQLARG